MEPLAAGFSMADVICDLEARANGEEAVGRTVERVLPIVEAHARAEESALASYHELMTASGDQTVALVMRLVLDDEEQHHTLLRRITSSMRDALYWTHSRDALPHTSQPAGSVSSDLVALARDLVREERQGASKLRDLAHQEQGINAGLDALLLEMMAMDSDKHARLLEFVAQRLDTRARRDDGPLD